MKSYETAQARLRAPLPDDPSTEDLLRFATLAANAHNTQPWRFSLNDDSVVIRPDLSRRTPVVDPDDHHLFASLGCAAEALSVAARARGFGGEVAVRGGESASIEVSLAPGPREDSALFAAIPERQCTRAAFDGTGVSPDVVETLVAEAASVGVTATWIPATDLSDLTDLVLQGNAAQMRDPAFVAELKSWLRFNATQAVQTGDGLFAACTGSPTAPAWLGRLLFDRFYSLKTETEKYRRQLRSSAGCFVLVAEQDRPAGWIAAGRAYQRLALRATALGLKNAFVNQAVEDPASRTEVARLIGLPDKRPNFVLRLGRAAPMPASLRRPVAAVVE